MEQKKPLIILTGPTAAGKTKLSIGLAKSIGGEIISADSMQVYKKMDIGTAKIRPEEMDGVPHYLVDEFDPSEEFNVVVFVERAKAAMEKIYAAGQEADILRKILADYNDPTVYNVGELGLGLNDKNELCGHMAPDEGSYGNLHIGIGKNLMFGGHTDSPLHMDLVMKKITADIDGLVIMKDGVLLV